MQEIKYHEQTCFINMFFPNHIQFQNEKFEVIYCGSGITISHDKNNYTKISLKDQQVFYKINVLGGFTFKEEKTGEVDFKKYFYLNWADDISVPELIFHEKPVEIKREYKKGQRIELGVEDVSCYQLIYKDNVTADFTRTKENAYDFSFSTGFTGSIKKDPDGYHSIKFKGISLEAEEDGYKSESKFIISRSKYTDNLLLILQDDANVFLV